MNDPRAENMPWLTPYLVVSDAALAVSFYQRAFGFEPGTQMEEADGSISHAELSYRGQVIVMLAPEGAHGSPHLAPVSSGNPFPAAFYVYCDDPDALHQRAVAAGAEVVSPPQDMFWNDRVVMLRDPDGYHWNFARHLGGG